MNKLVKRGLKAYNIFLKNKLAASLMMLIPGLMMTFAAIQGNGNDTKSLPLMILLAGAVFSFWGFFRLGYSKCVIDRPNNADDRGGWRRDFFLLMLETVLYLIIAALGVYLLMNESLTNRILNLMAGGFTTFNGIMGAIRAFKGRDNKDFRWKFMLVLTLFELGWGIYFLIASESINIGSYLVMGIITSVAGLIEVISCLNAKTLKDTIKDGKQIVKTMKSDEKVEEPEELPEEVDEA
ncbi:DUF308 domain-containing protein [Candidatus Saccharibacteria bacterium]|nr:DUF308 domain-containing protein [Candidatus Saccharibacteria bacterium]